jgi:hypothetical protein
MLQPREVPVLLKGSLVYLSDDGTVSTTPPSHLEAV